jgi:hypothetical protein
MRSSALLIEGKSVLQKLRFIVQNKRPGADEAVAATLALASRATLDFAFAANTPETNSLARKAASKQDFVPVLKGRVPPTADCLNNLKTFLTYRPRPRRKEVSERERYAIAMLDSDIREFWRSVVSPRNNMPPIAASVRASLLSPDNRLNATAWAKALLAWREERGLGFMLDEDGPLRDICSRMNRPGKRLDSDPVRAGFIKLAREHFVPLLKHEADQTDIASR